MGRVTIAVDVTLSEGCGFLSFSSNQVLRNSGRDLVHECCVQRCGDNIPGFVVTILGFRRCLFLLFELAFGDGRWRGCTRDYAPDWGWSDCCFRLDRHSVQMLYSLGFYVVGNSLSTVDASRIFIRVRKAHYTHRNAVETMSWARRRTREFVRLWFVSVSRSLPVTRPAIFLLDMSSIKRPLIYNSDESNNNNPYGPQEKF